MSEKQNDSPAFRLRPRAEPKSYYTIRLEYSANPAAFTRERPRSSLTKRRDTSKRSSYSRSKLPRANGNKTGGQQYDGHHNAGLSAGGGEPVKQVNVMTKEDIEREERRKQLQRELSHSITTDKMISPFLQRLELDELKPSSIYEQNYITLRVNRVSVTKQQATTNNNNNKNEDDSDNILGKHIVCSCSSIDDSLLGPMDKDDILALEHNKIHLNVHLFDEFANEKLIKVDKIMNIAKFKTGPAISELKSSSSSPSTEVTKTSDHCPNLNFDVIVKYDDSLSSLSSRSSTATITSDSNRKKPLIPYVCITDMIEEPTDPYVEMPPPSPPPPATAHISTTTPAATVVAGAPDNNGNSFNIKTGG